MDQDAKLRGKVISGYVQEFSDSPFYVALYEERQLNIDLLSPTDFCRILTEAPGAERQL
jgi:hypothetical protein